MLNKQICKKCFNKYRHFLSDWNDKDEIRWNKYKIVHCPRYIDLEVNIDNNPFYSCYFYLEHLVLGQC